MKEFPNWFWYLRAEGICALFLHQPWKNGKTPRFSCVPFGLRNQVKIVTGICQGSVRCLSGIYQGSVRCLSGVCQGSIRGRSGVCLSGICQGSVRCLSGVYQGSIRCLSVRDLSGVYQGSVRGLSGRNYQVSLISFLGSKKLLSWIPPVSQRSRKASVSQQKVVWRLWVESSHERTWRFGCWDKDI